MKLGRIRRDPKKIRAVIDRANDWVTPAANRPGNHGRKLNVEVSVERVRSQARDANYPHVHRQEGRYEARACVRKAKAKSSNPFDVKSSVRCGLASRGRTPQSAVAKALKSLSATVAKSDKNR